MLTFTTGGAFTGSATWLAMMVLNSSLSMSPVTTPMARLPTAHASIGRQYSSWPGLNEGSNGFAAMSA